MDETDEELAGVDEGDAGSICGDKEKERGGDK
jgi:hypothetical protein